jgi:uncharacterized membrane protein YfcA
MTIAALLQPFSTAQVVASMIVVFLTAIMRGYTGFGFALVAVPLLALIADPVTAVPMVLLLEVVGSLQLLPGLWRSAHLRSVMMLVAGALVATPIGLYGLASLPADVMRLVIGLVVLATTCALAAGLKASGEPGAPATFGVGILSGLLNGAAAMSGPPVVLFYLNAHTAMHVGRASIILYFLLSDAVAIGFAGASGLLVSSTAVLAAVTIPALFLGQAIGTRLFRSALQRHYRIVAIVILLAVSGFAIAQSVHALWGNGG